MRVSRIIVLVVMITIMTNCGGQSPPADPMVLVECERAFAGDAAEQGTRDAFLAHCADDAVMFVPGALYVKEHYGDSPSRPGHLSWTPIYAEIASGGDLGWTTGPWEWRQQSAADTPVAFGHYVTIWELQPDSTWKFILDIGTAHGAHDTEPPAPALRVLDGPEKPAQADPDRARDELLETEYTFSAASRSEGLVAAYLLRVAPDIRYYRMGQKPQSGVEALSTALSLFDGTWTWEVDHAEVARSADLGYTFGVSTLVGPETTTRFSFTHIWRRDVDGLWKLALDIHIPLPPETEETP